MSTYDWQECCSNNAGVTKYNLVTDGGVIKFYWVIGCNECKQSELFSSDINSKPSKLQEFVNRIKQN